MIVKKSLSLRYFVNSTLPPELLSADRHPSPWPLLTLTLTSPERFFLAHGLRLTSVPMESPGGLKPSSGLIGSTAAT